MGLWDYDFGFRPFSTGVETLVDLVREIRNSPFSIDCVFDASLVPETCLELPFLRVCFGIRFGKP